jgi:predicted naringenin-chalcone synthase
MGADKEILYNVLKRNVDNITRNVPILGMFSDTISNYIIRYIDPYVNGFMDDDKLDIDQLSEFTKYEVNNKIDEFKNFYKTQKGD